MKYYLLFLLCLCLSFSNLHSQTIIEVGTEPYTTTDYFPIGGWWGYTYTQQIYLQSQISTSGYITTIRFYFLAGDFTKSLDWVIYLGYTSKTAFSNSDDWISISNLTKVFDNTVTYPSINNWIEIELETPFYYNNSDNLVVAIDENTPGYDTNKQQWRSFTSGTNTGMIYRNDALDVDPASPPSASFVESDIAIIQMVFCSPPEAPIDITDEAIKSICSGNSTTLTVTGSGTISWYDSEENGNFIESTDSFLTPNLYSDTTYYAQDSTCMASKNRTAVSITVNNHSTSSITETACDSYTAPDGAVYTTSGIKAAVIENVTGCDSTITIDLTINYSNTGTDAITACDSYTWIDGNTYTSSNNTATHTLTNVNGCDSVVTLDLTINTVDISVTENAMTLTANLSGATYQWIDCNGNNNPVSGETNQSFTVTVNGSYAVIIDDGTCVDTSICYTITGVSVKEITNTSINIYPNPTSDIITIEGEEINNVNVTDINGKIVKQLINSDKQVTIDLTENAKGIYFVSVETNKEIFIKKIVLE